MAIFNCIVAGHTASLPMDRYKTEQFLYDLGIDPPDAEYEMELVNGSDFLLVLDSNFRELNRLARRISEMGDYDYASLNAWASAQDICTVNDALRATCHLDKMEFHPGVDTDEMLGEFALDNGIFEDYNYLPTDIYEMLDQARVGARLREQDGGQFINGGYLIAGDITGEDFPTEEPLAFFQVRFSNGGDKSAWFDVPLNVEDKQIIKTSFGCGSIYDLHISCCSSLPQIPECKLTEHDYGRVCALTEHLNAMTAEDLLKYKAVMETAENPDIYLALKRAQQLDSFDFEPKHADVAAYGRQVLITVYGLHDDDVLLEHVDMAGFGLVAAQESEYEITRYGAVRLPPWLEAAKTSLLAAEAHASLMESCEQNDWLMNYNEYPAHDYPYTFEEIDDAETLAARFRYGNWSIRTGFLYGGLAFVQQVNGGDEWLALRQDASGQWNSFDSISMEHILQSQGTAAFESYVDDLVRMHGSSTDQGFGEITMQ